MKKYLIAGLLVAYASRCRQRVLRGARRHQPQMLGRVEEAGRHEGDHARYRWLQEQVGSPFAMKNMTECKA